LEVLPIPSSVKRGNFDLFDSLLESGPKFKTGDIIVISSKYVSMSEGAILRLNKVKISKKARMLASKFHMDPKIAEITLRESDYIFGGLPGFLLSIRDGMIAPNAGIDKSNVPRGLIVLYPTMPSKLQKN
jgi:coenzyme F420-0:L-glutamate ligase/coenzyme F420-1:gamma-L-glutamate ligase